MIHATVCVLSSVRCVELCFICYLQLTVLLATPKGVLICMAFISCLELDECLKNEIILPEIVREEVFTKSVLQGPFWISYLTSYSLSVGAYRKHDLS